MLARGVATAGSGRGQGGVTVSLRQPTFRSSLVSYALRSNVLPCDLERREFQGYSASVIRIGSIVLRVDDLERQTAFWTAALDYVPREEASDDFVLLRPKNGVGPNVSLDRHHSSLQIPPRIHLDLYADNQSAEVRRLIALGANEVRWDKRPADADYVILADPEGNRFCVVDASAGVRLRRIRARNRH
jgi:catechol 2,3-dioxygenase-like lactoylglutathione lyase family enzyme